MHLNVGTRRNVFGSILESIAGGISSAANGTGLVGNPLLEAVSEVVKSAVREAVQSGRALLPSCKAIIMGVVRGSGAKREAGLQLLAHAARTVIHHTADTGGNLTTATKGLVLGAIASARDLDVSFATAASAAAQGALEGAGDRSSVTVAGILAALKDPIGEDRIALPVPYAP